MVLSSPISDVPSAPTGPIKVFDVTEDSCVLEWKPPQSDGGTPLTKYIIEMRDIRRSVWNRVDEVKPTELEYEVFNLVLGNEYMFRIIAVNAEGEGPPLNLIEAVQPMRELGQLVHKENNSVAYLHVGKSPLMIPGQSSDPATLACHKNRFK